MPFAAFRRREKIQLLAAGVAIGALVAGASASQAAECGDLAGKFSERLRSPPRPACRRRQSLLGMDPPDSRRDQVRRSVGCRASIKPSPIPTSDSRCGFRRKDAWNGRYGAIGNGGFAGSLIFPR